MECDNYSLAFWDRRQIGCMNEWPNEWMNFLLKQKDDQNHRDLNGVNIIRNIKLKLNNP